MLSYCTCAYSEDSRIPSLVAEVSDGTERQKISAAVALWSLAANADNKIAIAQAGGIPPLVALVRDGTDAQKASAAAALRNLAANADNKIAIAKAKREAGVAPEPSAECCSLL